MEMKALGLCSSSLQIYRLIVITWSALLDYCNAQLALTYVFTANETGDTTTSNDLNTHKYLEFTETDIVLGFSSTKMICKLEKSIITKRYLRLWTVPNPKHEKQKIFY